MINLAIKKKKKKKKPSLKPQLVEFFCTLVIYMHMVLAQWPTFGRYATGSTEGLDCVDLICIVGKFCQHKWTLC